MAALCTASWRITDKKRPCGQGQRGGQQVGLLAGFKGETQRVGAGLVEPGGLEQVFARRVFARLGFPTGAALNFNARAADGRIAGKVVQIQAQLLAFGDNQQLEHFAMGVGARRHGLAQRGRGGVV
jgi:hypothetical protein